MRSIIRRKKEQGFDADAGQVCGLPKRMFDYAQTCSLLQANPVMAFADAARLTEPPLVTGH